MATIITLAHRKSGGAKSKLALILPLCLEDELKITFIDSYLQGDLCNLRRCYLKGKRPTLVREVVSQVYYVDILEGLARLFSATLSTGLCKQLSGKLAAPAPDHFVLVLYRLGLRGIKDEIKYLYEGAANYPLSSNAAIC